jgi:multisubunit Na+/H+ antiporter MnhE subunit
MRFLQHWWRTLVFTNQYNPPESIEHLMVLLSIAFAIHWGLLDGWPYLVLSSSFALGAAVSMWTREVLMPSSRPRLVLVAAIAILLLYSLYAFADLVHNYL